MNEFLRTQSQVDCAHRFVDEFGWQRHACHWKDWDLSHVLPMLRDGNLLDMGCFCSYVLPNAAKRGILGEKWGVDLTPMPESHKAFGVNYLQRSLVDTGLKAGSFSMITCLSVLEHSVDYGAFLNEAYRLLKPLGTLIVTFDYWPTIYPHLPADWQLLNLGSVRRLIALASERDLNLRVGMDWTVKDAIINAREWTNSDARYTFGIIEFVKGL